MNNLNNRTGNNSEDVAIQCKKNELLDIIDNMQPGVIAIQETTMGNTRSLRYHTTHVLEGKVIYPRKWWHGGALTRYHSALLIVHLSM